MLLSITSGTVLSKYLLNSLMNVAPMSHVINKGARSMRIRKLEHTWSKEVVGRSYLLIFFCSNFSTPFFSRPVLTQLSY